jgi:hypothetical protein
MRSIVLFVLVGALASAGAQPASETAPEPIPAPAVDCRPACRPGYLCVQGKCVSECNPECPSGYLCRDGDCVADPGALWWVLSVIISCGTLAGAIIPEFTKVFTSTHSRHVREVVSASQQGGASLNILSGFVAGNFSAFWKGLVILSLMLVSYLVSQHPALTGLMPAAYSFAAPIFAFGLVAFGFLGMGPVTIAVDSFGPVTDNAQSVYELSQIEAIPNVREDIRKEFGFEPQFEKAKYELEKADGAGNTFKATAKPVLIGTAVVGATTMVFSIIMLLEGKFGNVMEHLSLVQPEIRYEDPEHIYPHIYGPLNRDAIVTIVPMLRNADGTFLPPKGTGDW